jgi:hypothetical protein
MELFRKFRDKLNRDGLFDWSRERSPHGKTALREGLSEILKFIGRLFRG